MSFTNVTVAEGISNPLSARPKTVLSWNRSPKSNKVPRHNISSHEEEFANVSDNNSPLFISGIINEKETSKVIVDKG